jgi:hypothetical protein
MRAVQSPDASIVQSALFISRTVVTAVRGSPFVKACAPAFLEMIDGLLGRFTALAEENVLEDAWSTFAVLVASLPRAAAELVNEISVSIGDRFEATLAATSPAAVRHRLAMAEVIRVVAVRNDESMERFVEPYLKMILRCCDSDDPEPNLLGAMAAIFETNRVEHSAAFAMPAIAFGINALRNGNRHVVSGAAQMISRIVASHQLLLIDVLLEVLELGCNQLLNYESDSLVAAAIVEMISYIVTPSRLARRALEDLFRKVRHEVMELFAGVAAVIPLMSAGDACRTLAFTGLLRGYAGMATLYQATGYEHPPGAFLGPYLTAYESLPKIGVHLRLYDEAVIDAFLSYLEAILYPFSGAGHFSVAIHRSEFVSYLELARTSTNPQVQSRYRIVRHRWAAA